MDVSVYLLNLDKHQCLEKEEDKRANSKTQTCLHGNKTQTSICTYFMFRFSLGYYVSLTEDSPESAFPTGFTQLQHRQIPIS